MHNIEMIKDLRMKFIQGENIDAGNIRLEVFESWVRCRKTVDPLKKQNTSLLDAEELKRLKLQNKELIDVTLPVMQNLYAIINNSTVEIFLSVIKGEDQLIIESIGDDDATHKSSQVKAIPGSNWSEREMGTSATALAAIHDRPIQLFPYENYCFLLGERISTAAPIHDPETNSILGVITLTTVNVKLFHPHTMSMVVVLVNLIEKQIATIRLIKRAEIDNHYKNLIMEAYGDGLIAIDERMNITQINQKALNIFEIESDPLGKNIIVLLSDIFGTINKPRGLVDMIRSKSNVNDEFIHIQTPFGAIRLAVTTRSISLNDKVIGKVLIIQEMSRVNNLVARTVGNNARFTFDDLVGRDKKFRCAVETAMQVCNTTSNILLMGESGTGKDLFAQSIHNASGRSGKPYIAINCAAVSRELIGSELFGYVEGAFTGAKKGGSPGKFELADGGTIFLDEIGEMPLDMQTALLRVLEERAVTRIGGRASLPVDVRVIAATNKNLVEEVDKGQFREDLYYRLNVVSIQLPPLRERKEDIPVFIAYLASKISRQLGKKIKDIDREFILTCSNYDWPGNIRELQNTIERCVNLAKSAVLTLNLLPEHILNNTLPVNDLPGLNKNLKKYGKLVESSLIKNYLMVYGGNVDLVARELGISRSTLYRRLNDQ